MLRAGIELEMYVKLPKELTKFPKFKQGPGVNIYAEAEALLSWTRREVAKALSGAGLNCEALDTWQTVNENQKYETWYAAEEMSLEENLLEKGYKGVEMISRILTTSTESLDEIRKVYEVLEGSGMEIEILNRNCATQVHMSPNPAREWTTEELRRLSVAILFYEADIDLIVPEERRTTRWTKSNLQSVIESLDSKNKYQAIAAIGNPEIPKMEFLVQMSCASQTNKSDRRPEKRYKWSFQPLSTPEGKRTVEHRQAPGSRTGEEAVGWFLFSTGFTTAAAFLSLEETPDELPSLPAELEDSPLELKKLVFELQRRPLKQFIIDGLKLCKFGDSDMAPLNAIFEGK